MLAQIFTSETRAQLFGLLFNGAGKEYYLREIERLTGKAVRAIQQEVKHLSEIDLIKSRKDGNRIYYKANKMHPLYPELTSMVEKTVGVFAQLKERLSDNRIECAFVFGSFAKEKENSESDIDLIVVGDLGMRALTRLLSGLQENIGREINPHIYSVDEFQVRIKKKDHFITSVLKEEVKELIGSINDYR